MVQIQEPTAVPRPRAAATGRPAADPGCAGCAQLGTFRALRRAGLEVQGGIGCDPASDAAFVPTPGRWAAVTGVARVLRTGAPALLAEAAGAGARLLLIVDRAPRGGAAPLESYLARAGARVLRVDPADLAGSEAAARAAGPGAVLLALYPCPRGAPRAAPLEVVPSRCNRCGACLALGCAALSDPGGEAMAVDPAACTGCRLCAPLCRAGALVGPRVPRPPRRVAAEVHPAAA
jgi:TPP-dependent indolepyruvate ferredoxin oxidoreductase alpha subunit